MGKGKYPECEKLAAVREKSQAAGEFLDWLKEEKKILLYRPHVCDEDCREGFMIEKYNSCPRSDEETPVHESTLQFLQEFFRIDPNKLEEERMAMLEECRKLHKKREAL